MLSHFLWTAITMKHGMVILKLTISYRISGRLVDYNDDDDDVLRLI
jgi:hypothetical protein